MGENWHDINYIHKHGTPPYLIKSSLGTFNEILYVSLFLFIFCLIYSQVAYRCHWYYLIVFFKCFKWLLWYWYFYDHINSSNRDEQSYYILILGFSFFCMFFTDNCFFAYENSYAHFFFLFISSVRTAQKRFSSRGNTHHPYLIPDFIRTSKLPLLSTVLCRWYLLGIGNVFLLITC